jgi:hypothetical protein
MIAFYNEIIRKIPGREKGGEISSFILVLAANSRISGSHGSASSDGGSYLNSIL